MLNVVEEDRRIEVLRDAVLAFVVAHRRGAEADERRAARRIALLEVTDDEIKGALAWCKASVQP